VRLIFGRGCGRPRSFGLRASSTTSATAGARAALVVDEYGSVGRWLGMVVVYVLLSAFRLRGDSSSMNPLPSPLPSPAPRCRDLRPHGRPPGAGRLVCEMAMGHGAYLSQRVFFATGGWTPPPRGVRRTDVERRRAPCPPPPLDAPETHTGPGVGSGALRWGRAQIHENTADTLEAIAGRCASPWRQK